MDPNLQTNLGGNPNAPRKGFDPAVVLLGLVGATIVLIVFFSTLNYFNILSMSRIFPNQLGWLPHRSFESLQKEKDTSSNIPQTKSSYELPIDPSKESITLAEVSYNIQAKIKSIIPSSNGITMEVTVPKDETIIIPKLTLTSEVKIIKGKPGLEPGSLSDLGIGKDVNLIVSYDLKNKEWRTRSIYFLYTESPPATGSANR